MLSTPRKQREENALQKHNRPLTGACWSHSRLWKVGDAIRHNSRLKVVPAMSRVLARRAVQQQRQRLDAFFRAVVAPLSTPASTIRRPIIKVIAAPP